MSKRSKAAAIVFAAVAATPVAVLADVLAQWNFNSSTAPSTVDAHFLATPAVTLIGGVTASLASGSGSSDPTQPGQAYNLTTFPSQSTASGTAGAEYDFNTSNYTLSTFNFDLRTSNTSSRYYDLQYSTDGSTWTNGQVYTAAVADGFNNNNSFDFSSIGAASNNSNFRIRVVSVFSPNAFSDGTTSYVANTAYQLAQQQTPPLTKSYAGTGTWRFDMVTLNGVYVPPVFTPANLTWNTTSGTWDSVVSNKPWLNGVTPSAFSQSSGQGDNVTFSNPADGSVITIQAGGVTPNSMTVNNSGTLTFTGGPISGAGGLVKSGAGRLIMASSNSFTGVSTPTMITGGVVETRASNALGSGPVSLSNMTWNATTAAQSFGNTASLDGPVTFDTAADLTISGLAGTGSLMKIGNGTLGIGGINSNTGPININAGTVRMDNMGALGGNAGGPVTPVLNINNAALIFNAAGGGTTGVRPSADILLNNSTMTRNQITPGIGPSPTNGDSELSAYTSGLTSVYSGGVFIVTGNSMITNLETRTAASSDTPGSGGSSNAAVIRMPIVISTGGTLTLNPVNDTISTVGGQPTGNLANTGIALRGPQASGINDNDSLTLQAGSALVMTGASEKRIGSNTIGKPIVAFGTPGADAIIKADAHTYMTDLATAGNNTLLVVSGTGSAGLRIEAPMNASYNNVSATFTAGLFGANPDTSETTVGNVYTIMSPNRYAGLSGFSNMPTVGADNHPITIGGTLTLAANDPAGATGIIDNGPAAPSPLVLAIDNTATSGNLVYQIDPTVNPGKISNFAGLSIKRSNTSAGFVKAVLSSGTLALQSLTIDPTAQFDIGDHPLIVNYGPADNNATRNAIRNLLINGRNAGPASPAPWNGLGGITSSYAHANGNGFNLAIGYADNAVLASINAAGSYTSFGGQTVASSTILVQMTYGADANLDGKVDGSDVSIIGTHFNQPGSGQWYFGDFDYSGMCDGNDISVLGTTFGQTSPALSPAQLTAEFGSAFASAFEAGQAGAAAVPEPSSLTVVAMVGMGWVAKRRRSRADRG